MSSKHQENGAESIKIKNIDTLFRDIDCKVNGCKPPSVEYILAKPHSSFKLFGLGFNPNLYGHSAVRYTMPDGEQKVFNITGYKNGELVAFHSPEKYMLTSDTDQGGLQNRAFIGIRIENLPDENLHRLDKKFQEIHDQGVKHNAKFDIVLGPIFNTLRKVFPVMAERGNCARWSSVGLKEAGVTHKKTMFPKTLFVDILENTDKTDVGNYEDNVHIVSYRPIERGKRNYGVSGYGAPSLIAPLQTFSSLCYWNLESYAHAIVDVPDPENEARVTLRDPDTINGPSKLRNAIVNNPLTIVASTVSTVYMIKRYPGRFVSRVMGIFRR